MVALGTYPRVYPGAANVLPASSFTSTAFTSGATYIAPTLAAPLQATTVTAGVSYTSPTVTAARILPSTEVVSSFATTAVAPSIRTVTPETTTVTGFEPRAARVISGGNVVSATPIPTTKAEVGFKLKLGAEIPNFPCETTQGNFDLHDFITSGPQWTVLFSHPADFTPVCTTELGRCEAYGPEFQARGVQLIGLSCDPIDAHLGWSTDILFREGIDKPDGMLSFPIIADAGRTIALTLGMIDPEEINSAGIALAARALIVLDQTKKVKLAILYPATTGRNFDEILRVIDSLTLTKDKSLATPADWRPGDRCIVAPSVKTEDAAQKFEDLVIESLPSGKEYLRHVQCPAA